MNFQDYQKLACRTKPEGTQNELLTNFAMGISGEGGEMVDLIKKVVFHGHPLDEELIGKLIYEMGDMLWYLASLSELLDVDLTTVAYANIQKLKERYPEGFSKTASIKRAELT